jgi:hypothetical protein
VMLCCPEKETTPSTASCWSHCTYLFGYNGGGGVWGVCFAVFALGGAGAGHARLDRIEPHLHRELQHARPVSGQHALVVNRSRERKDARPVENEGSLIIGNRWGGASAKHQRRKKKRPKTHSTRLPRGNPQYNTTSIPGLGLDSVTLDSSSPPSVLAY